LVGLIATLVLIHFYSNDLFPLYDTSSLISNEFISNSFYSHDDLLEFQSRSYFDAEKEIQVSNKVKLFEMNQDEGVIKPGSPFCCSEDTKTKTNF
jgi:hypothetical protein